MARRAVFPGTFDPLTIAHVAIADAVHRELAATSVDLTISRVALGKEHVPTPVEDRLDAIRRLQDARPWLGASATDQQLVTDIAAGYDILVIGADKWHQMIDVRFYGGSVTARDDALARLPTLAVAPRAGAGLPARADVHVLSLPEEYQEVSSTAVRAGRQDWRA